MTRPVTVKEAILEASTNGLDIKYLLLEGKTSKYIKLLKPGERLESLYEKINGPGKKAYFAFSRTHPDRPARTIAKDSAGLFHFSEDRTLSIGEYKRVASFPDGFIFNKSFNAALMRIGNSVPPLFMKAIATQIRHVMWGGQKLEPYSETMNYLEILELAWQDHLRPKEVDAPTVISLFAGGGGSSLGYSMSGYRELLAVEWDDNAVATFKLNFPDIPVYHGDIAELSVNECMKLARLTEPRQLDLLDDSPPCQGFSTAGKRILNDPRNQLFREYVRLLRELQPKVFVMENVSGLVKGKMKLVFAEIMRELKASGYQVKCQLMNAKYFYVPQSRERLIFIGVREDLKIKGNFPKAENGPIAASEAIKEASIDDCGRPKGLLADRMKNVKPGSNLGRTERSNRHFSYIRCPIGKPAMTIQKSVTFGGISMWHPYEERNCSKGELKRIASYPDAFSFAGNYEDVVNRIGNSVPPLFMRAIASHIRQEILSKIILTHQDPVLLSE